MAKAVGATGFTVIKAQPLILVAVPTIGALFCHRVGTLLGNNTAGRLFNSVGNLLKAPLGFVELSYNVYIAPFVNRTLGLPTILNYTKQIQRSPGLDSAEAIKLLEASRQKPFFEMVKDFAYHKFWSK